MRKVLYIFCMVLAAINMEAGSKITVSLIKQYSDTTFNLPKNTIEKKMKCVVAKKDSYVFPKMLKDSLSKMQSEDYGNRVFTLLLMGSGKGIKIDAKSEDIIDNDSTEFFGDFVIENKHFVMIQNEDNAELLKLFFKKTGDTVFFQRRFVLTDNIVNYQQSSLDAFYNEYDNKLVVKKYIINGEDRTNKKSVANTIITNDDEDDAFKLDVEILE